MRIFVLGNEHNANFLPSESVTSLDIRDNPTNFKIEEPPNLLLFTGGQDISPSLYGRNYPFIHFSKLRDTWEVTWYKWAVKHKVPMFGICRGMQLFTALTGGELIPDVEGHFGHHLVYSNSLCCHFEVNSIHHQMCVPNQKGNVLAFTRNIAFEDDTNEPEAIVFPEIKALGVQWHPEMMPIDSTATQQVHKWIKEYLT